jgi:regulator of sigma E protease
MHHLYELARTIIEFAIVLGIMVLVHEFGHFLVAKLCGVRIETFAIGFGTRLFGYVHNGTDYCLRALPLGGYVKMAGELQPSGDITVTGAPDEFTSKTRFQRVLIALAGPAANFVLSFFLLFLVAHYHHEVDQYLNGPAVVDYVPVNTPAAHDGLTPGDTIVSFNGKANPTWEAILEESQFNLNRTVPFSFLHDGSIRTGSLTVHSGDGSGEVSPDDIAAAGLIPREQTVPISVTDVQSDSPAARAGMQTGDLLLRIDGIQPHSVPALLAYLRDRNGATSEILVQRQNHTLTLNVTPTMMPVPNAPTQYRLGFSYRQPPVDITQLPIAASLHESVKENAHGSTFILRTVQGLFTRQVSVKQMSGPVGIAQVIDVKAQEGFWPLVAVMAAISINLAIFNLLPFPPLDGGMIFFLLIESIIRRDVNQQVKERIYQVAFVCIIFLAIFVMFNDITRLHIGKP